MLKFTLNVQLGKLHPSQKRVVIKELQAILNCSYDRLTKIRNAKIEDNVSLKDWQLKAVADFFQIPMEDVLTKEFKALKFQTI